MPDRDWLHEAGPSHAAPRVALPILKPLRIALAGLGTVGTGTLRLLSEQADLLARRCGRHVTVTDVSARDRSRDRGVALAGPRWHDDAVEMARSADVDVVVELIGGADGPAKAVCDAALARGRPVVPANKAPPARHPVPVAR